MSSSAAISEVRDGSFSPKGISPAVSWPFFLPLPSSCFVASDDLPFHLPSRVFRLSRSSLKRPRKKIWTSSSSPCWSTAAQRRWTRGSVSILSLLISHSSHHQSFPCSYFNVVWGCMILGTHNIHYARVLLNISVIILHMINVNVLQFSAVYCPLKEVAFAYWLYQ